MFRQRWEFTEVFGNFWFTLTKKAVVEVEEGDIGISQLKEIRIYSCNKQIITPQSGTVLIIKYQIRLPRSRNDNVLKLTSITSLEQHTRKRLGLEKVTTLLPALFTLVFLKSPHFFFLLFYRIKIPRTNSNLQSRPPPSSKPGLSGKSVLTNKQTNKLRL